MLQRSRDRGPRALGDGDERGAERERSRPYQRALEAQVDELRRELTAASELVTNLAEQNSRLVSAVEILRVRTRVLFLATVIIAAALILLAAVVLSR